MKLRTRLLAAQAPLLLALAAFAYVATTSLGTVGRSAERILRDNYRSVLAAQRMKESAERLDSGVLFAAAGRPEAGDEQIRAHLGEFEAELSVQERNLTEADEHTATGELRAAWNAYRATIDAYASVAPDARIDAYFRDVGPAFVRVKGAANRILEINQDAMTRKSDEAAATSRRLGEILVLASLAACAAGAVVSGMLTARILRPIGILQQTARRIGEGDLATRARVAGGAEIEALATEINAMAERLQAYRASTLAELLEAQTALHAAIDSLPDPVLVVGPAGDVRDVNSAAETTVCPGLAGRRAPTISDISEPLRAVIATARDRAMRGGAAAATDLREAVRVERPDGPMLLLPRATAVRSPDGEVVAATVVLQDVTRLVRSDEMKDDLVSTVAHEFRTPLTSLRMAIHLCLEEVAGPTTEKQRDLLAASRSDCERLQRLVDEMLDLARIRSGRTTLDLAPAAPGGIARAAVAASETAAREKGVTITAEVSPDAGEVRLDTERIGLALGNLVANAVRHSPRAEAVNVVVLAVEGGVRFEVSDRGPGVPDEVRATIFERGTRGAGGGAAGLGLWIAREIVRAHGGTIGVDPRAGGGSVFWFVIPSAR